MTDRTTSPTSRDDEPSTIRFGEPDRDPPTTPDPTPDPGPSSGEPSQSANPNRPNLSGELGDSSERALRAAVEGSSTRASTEAAAANLSPIVAALLQGGGAVLHQRRTPGAQRWLDPAQSATALIWVPTADEAAGVAEPLARIAARRLPEGVGGDSDLADVLGATLAAGMFTIGQVMAEQHWRAATRGPVGPQPLDPEPEPEPPAGWLG